MVTRRSCDAGGRCQWFYARPDTRLRPGIGIYRGFRSTAGTPQERLVVPTGRVSLFIGFGSEIRLGRTAAGREGTARREGGGRPGGGREGAGDCTGTGTGRDAGGRTGGGREGGAGTGAGWDTEGGTGAGWDAGGRPALHTSVVSGLHTRARVLGHQGDLHGVELTLAPWAAYRLFGSPLGELADVLTDPADVLGRRARDLTAALEAAPGWAGRFAALDETLLRWAADVAPSREPSPAVLRAWELLNRTSGAVPVRELAARCGWSPRHLENRFREQIGLTPKRLARILRLNRAIRQLTAGGRPADVAAGCGFYDQSHLSREFTALTGMPPGRFLATRKEASAWLAG
ncbi:helix-turn-helix domain-containing protein [Streptomyces sp. NPDC056399]|uniref:helix-turn-helix domain-containing protein n=1 Tax=Streptomyces sp. NPDC056399 TaxID=3345807 RepID=UPI0035DB7638